MKGKWWVAPQGKLGGSVGFTKAHFISQGSEAAVCGASPHLDYFGKVVTPDKWSAFPPQMCKKCIAVVFVGCDFCEKPQAKVKERLGDKSACAACCKVDEGKCQRCYKPFRVLDAGGTLMMDTKETVCESCWRTA